VLKALQEHGNTQVLLPPAPPIFRISDPADWDGSTAYAESKLHDAILGWVATKMGGSGAPDDINQAHLTQVWLGPPALRSALV
jgi:hypothetical protein